MLGMLVNALVFQTLSGRIGRLEAHEEMVLSKLMDIDMRLSKVEAKIGLLNSRQPRAFFHALQSCVRETLRTALQDRSAYLLVPRSAITSLPPFDRTNQ